MPRKLPKMPVFLPVIKSQLKKCPTFCPLIKCDKYLNILNFLSFFLLWRPTPPFERTSWALDCSKFQLSGTDGTFEPTRNYNESPSPSAAWSSKPEPAQSPIYCSLVHHYLEFFGNFSEFFEFFRNFSAFARPINLNIFRSCFHPIPPIESLRPKARLR